MLELLLNPFVTFGSSDFTLKINMIKRRGKAALPGKAMVTYPYWMKLRTFLARQDPHSGLTEEKLESNHLSRGAGKPSQNRVAPLPGIDVENLSKEDMIELVTKMASGHKIQYILDRETGKEELHVMMHSLTPHLMVGKAVEVKESKERENTSSGQRTEVNIFPNQLCILILLMQAPALNKGGKDPLPEIRRSMKKMARKDNSTRWGLN